MERVNERVLSFTWIRYDVINYAMQQNFVPIIRKLNLHNHTAVDLSGVQVRLKTEPQFAAEWSTIIDHVPQGQPLELGPVHLQVNGTYLAGLTERLTGLLTLEVSHEGQVLIHESVDLTLLAYDQWSGLTVAPEMVVAFIMPNHPVIAQILREASAWLGKWTGNPSFDAYQSRSPNRVQQQAAAIYNAIQAHQPTYCVAPASFEELGQRVRLPDAVISMHKMGNCLDLTLLYTACLEAAGLHPLVIFTEGHVFPGVWLVEETFAESLQDDISLLSKRLASGVHEISIVEATAMCAGSQSTYQDAAGLAAQHLTQPDKFEGFIDVKRARSSGIRPIPIRITSAAGGFELLEDESVGKAAQAAGEAPEEIVVQARPVEVDAISMTKLKQWERKLLDLTLRNTLLNFRMTKSALPLLHSRLGELEDALADGQEFQLLPKPADWDRSARSAELFQQASHEHPLTLLVHEEFRSKRLRVDADERQLLEKAIHLYRSAKLSLEENGANTLFLAFGLLRWYESAASEQPRYAPIVLVPVELVRRTSRAGFVLRLRDEEPQVNITLLEMLRQDFGIGISGLDPLPRDEHGIDLAGVFATVRHVIMNLSRWDVVETAIIGLFSFNRFVMWNDIRSRADDLARNKVVASLIAGRLDWAPETAFPQAAELDNRYTPDQLMLPISADSSQVAAITAANNEQSFVLHGPPGTGKSQTITNMIASTLASGKTVLFVAEKMAALSVVQSRLEAIGLGPFCLELHSNKSTKKAVLEQLRLSLEAAHQASPEEWRQEAARLASARSELNAYVEALHRKYDCGATLYEAIGHYGRVKTAVPIKSIDPAIAGAMTREQWLSWDSCAKELRIAGEAAGHPFGHAWTGAACSTYTPALRSQAAEWLASYASRLAELRQVYADVTAWLGYTHSDPTAHELNLLEAAAECLRLMPAAVPHSLLRNPDWSSASEHLTKVVQHGRARNELRNGLQSRFTADVLTLDAATVLAEWKSAELQWFVPKLLKQNRIYKLLRKLALPGRTLAKTDVAAALTQVIQYQEASSAIKQLEPAMAPLLGSLWNSGEADWDGVQQLNEWGGTLQQATVRLYQDEGQAKLAVARLADQLIGGVDTFLHGHGASCGRYVTINREREALEQQLSELLKIDFAGLDTRRDGQQTWLDYRAGLTTQWIGATDELREWCSWRLVRDRAVEAGLTSLVSAYESGELQHDEVVPAFQRAWWQAVIHFIVGADQRLSAFSGKLFEEKIRAFRELDERFEQLTRQEIAARLAANVPPLSSAAASSSEAGILLRAIRSGGRGLSLRKLFEQIPNLLTRLCPCMLMSPMSVAQFVDPKYAPFDLVVFDEASQMPTSEAVGAMARGRNVVVVGDPKQLPPTSFFSAAPGEEEANDATVPDDLESILDDCLALGMPQEHLLWHYRSRHESLIAFSNRHFYENKLLTFPSPWERRSNVQWHPIEGFYDRGRTKQNRAEAEQVVADIVRRLRSTESPKHSVGVVTFNSIQQGLIEDLLDEAFRQDSELEQLASQLKEPIFIKNLENVQGDERDVILFSIGYGPDASGKVVLNFGPLNREGGWRRLNVAVSRARHEMHVYSTLRAEHLDMSRTQSQGVAMLRSFLEYAEKGHAALGIQADQWTARQQGFEAQIAEQLQEKGYKVELHVGTSGYRMDLAVVDPADPGHYVLAILTDGVSYREGATARDREVLREQVLRQLGWRVHRVWSLDWLDNPSKVIAGIVEAIQAAQTEERSAESKQKKDSAYAAVLDQLPRSAAAVEAEPSSKEEAVASISGQSSIAGGQAGSLQTWRMPYQPVALGRLTLPSEEIYSPINARTIRKQIAQVIQGEGPISRSLLVRKVLQSWGVARTTSRVERHLDELMKEMELRTTESEGSVFYWPMELDPERYEQFRVAEDDQDRRNAEDLPPEEIANALKELLFNQGSLPVEDISRETVKLLGYSRTGSALERAVQAGLQAAISRGYVEIDNGRISYRRG
jgi:very-short-patch-repair endonuclease